eukprot:SM000008S22228  [mRNA]  locus=s8:513312:514204:+ [translate_table: standard]
MADDDDCRPLGFLIGLPFMLIGVLLSIIGMVIWVVGTFISCICPCCVCVTLLIELAIALIRAPVDILIWFTSTIPC